MSSVAPGRAIEPHNKKVGTRSSGPTASLAALQTTETGSPNAGKITERKPFLPQ